MEKIALWNNQPETPDNFEPYLELSLLDDNQPHGAVIVCPGGGYCNRAAHEGQPVAERFNREGFHTFVLQYRVNPNRFPAPQQDVAQAVRIVRSKAAEWNIHPDKIAVLGFSAGGHLTASIGVYFDSEYVKTDDPLNSVSCRPDAIIPCYPVITSDPSFAHLGSVKNLFGEDYTAEQAEIFALEKHVTENTPPTFLWHTAEDGSVPVKNSLRFAEALNEKKVPVELHVFPEGGHGLGLRTLVPHVTIWPELAARWLRKMGW